jgi:hypothetical protein
MNHAIMDGIMCRTKPATPAAKTMAHAIFSIHQAFYG